MITIGKNERLVKAGEVSLRAPDGTPLPPVSQYMIVPADEADPSAVRELREGERIVLGGHIFSDRERAEARYAALKAGRKPPPRERGKPLYFVESTDGINPKTGLNRRDEREIDLLAIKFAEVFALLLSKNQADEDSNG